MEVLNPKISVIVPLFNREKTILKCLESIKNQVFTDFEVLIVDGQSTDNSRLIVSEFCKKDSRFVLLKNDFSHVTPDNVSIGLKNAKGDYITCVDSDDTILPEFLSELYELITKHKCDISQVEFCKDKEKKRKIKIYKGRKYLNVKKSIFKITKHHSRCLRLFKSDLKKYILKYYQKYHEIVWEDTIYTYALFLNAKSLVMSSKQLYTYNFVRNNDCPKRIYNEDYFDKIKKVHEINLQIFKDNSLPTWQAYCVPIIPIFDMFNQSSDKLKFVNDIKFNTFMFECVKKFKWKKGASQSKLILFKKACLSNFIFLKRIYIFIIVRF